MFINSEIAEKNTVLQTAQAMCAAARTAPKAKGVDEIVTGILPEEDLEKLAGEMETLGEALELAFFKRDAGNVRGSQAVVLIGSKRTVRGLGKACKLCGFEDCAACAKAGATCVYVPMDLGIAIGSAVSIAADARIDNRVMFSIGQTAVAMKLLGEDVQMIMGIPLSATGKAIYFDRG